MIEYLGEILALGLDSIILGICLRQYFHCQHSIKAVKNTELHDIGPNLNTIIQRNPGDKINYIAIRGIVKPLSKPLQSVNNPSIVGVIQRLIVREHVVARTTAGFWSDQERTIHEVCNTVPFALQNGLHKVEVIDALSAEILDMDIISDEFKPSAPSIADHIWGFFTGIRQRGVQSTEEMLREGVQITGFGQLSQSPDNPDCLTLQSPINGAPFYLTTMSISSLLRKLDERQRTYRWLCIVFGAFGLIIGGILAKRYWKDREEQRLEAEHRQNLAEARKERRQKVRDGELRDDQLCVVCRENPREIILLPCGHVCLCEDCADSIGQYCPGCRGVIEQKAAAYII